MEIWIPVLAALVTGILSFAASTWKSGKELKIVKIENELKLEQLKQQHRDDLEKQEREHAAAIQKMEAEVELKLKEYDATKETDVKYGFIEKFLSQAQTNPQQAIQSAKGLQDLVDSLKGFSNNDNK